MMSILDVLILIYGYAVSGIFIYLIDHGMDKKYQYMIYGIVVIIALCYAIFLARGEFISFNYGFITLPIIAASAFNLAGMVSWRINKREFRATWRGARYFYTESKNWSDYIMSFFVIMIELGWPILVVFFFKR